MTTPLTLCLAVGMSLSLSSKQTANACKYESQIIQYADRYNLEPELIAAVIYVESSFYPDVVSTANACGLMQVVPKWTGGPATAGKKYTCKQLKDPKTAIKVGSRILWWTINRYAKGNVDKGLCFYNAGSRCKSKNYYSRLYYVKKVKKVRDKIKSTLEGEP